MTWGKKKQNDEPMDVPTAEIAVAQEADSQKDDNVPLALTPDTSSGAPNKQEMVRGGRRRRHRTKRRRKSRRRRRTRRRRRKSRRRRRRR